MHRFLAFLAAVTAIACANTGSSDCSGGACPRTVLQNCSGSYDAAIYPDATAVSDICAVGTYQRAICNPNQMGHVANTWKVAGPSVDHVQLTVDCTLDAEDFATLNDCRAASLTLAYATGDVASCSPDVTPSPGNPGGVSLQQDSTMTTLGIVALGCPGGWFTSLRSTLPTMSYQVGEYSAQDDATQDPNAFSIELSFDTPLEYAAWGDSTNIVTYHPGVVAAGSVHVYSTGVGGHLSFAVDANLVLPAEIQPGAVFCADQRWHVLDNGQAGQY